MFPSKIKCRVENFHKAMKKMEMIEITHMKNGN